MEKLDKGFNLIFKQRCTGKSSRYYFLNDDHTYRPCDLMEWANQFEFMSRHVADDEINKCRVSTVWTGFNQNHFAGLPLVFETNVFNQLGEPIHKKLYSTWKQAEAGHQEAIDWVINRYTKDIE